MASDFKRPTAYIDGGCPLCSREVRFLKSKNADIDFVDVADEALTLEVVGDPGKLVALEQLLRPFGILEIARTGKVALQRASGVNTETLKLQQAQTYVPA